MARIEDPNAVSKLLESIEGVVHTNVYVETQDGELLLDRISIVAGGQIIRIAAHGDHTPGWLIIDVEPL